MLLFMFLLFPVVLTSYCFYIRSKKLVVPIFFGIMSSILLCAFKAFFLYSHRVIPYSISANVIFLLIRQTILPVFILLLLFFVFSRDEIEYKRDAICPLLLSFYMIYLPYSIVSTSEGLYSGFMIFIKPLLFAFMILFSSYCFGLAINAFKNKKYVFLALFSIAGIVYLVGESFIEALSVVNEYTGTEIILSIVYCLIPTGIFAIPFIKKLINR